MVQTLSQHEAERYNLEGFLSPIRVISAEKAEIFAENYREFNNQNTTDFDANAILRSKPHLVFPWLYDLVTSPRITDPVSSILGPNLLAWGSSFFAKRAGDLGFVSWHQDANYWGLEPHEVLTAWIAFSPSRPENGGMRVVPGSHLKGSLSHRDTFSKNNLLTRGQEIVVEIDESKVIDLLLEPGEMSLHHVSIVHGSEANTSDVDRIGFAIRYMSTQVRQVGGRTTATLARGIDEYKHFDLEPRPMDSFDEVSQQVRKDALKRQHDVLFKGVDKTHQKP